MAPSTRTAWSRRACLTTGIGLLTLPRPAAASLDAAVEQARRLPRLRTLLVARGGTTVVEESFRGPATSTPVNVKSAAKTVLSALTGVAIERGVLTGVEQPIAPILGNLVPDEADPRVADITVEHLLTMRAGLERTSGPGYGAWVSSRNWVRYALSRPFVDEPGGSMLYSTGSSHLLSAVLTRASGRSTLQLARDWLGEPLGITIPPWTRDPQGIYMGGNNMALSPRALLRLGEAYRQGGTLDRRRVVPESWVAASWTPRTQSFFTGHAYGYGWFISSTGGHGVSYAWGYGGQMLYVVPGLDLTVVITSDPDHPSGRDGYVDLLHGLLAEAIVPAIGRAG